MTLDKRYVWGGRSGGDLANSSTPHFRVEKATLCIYQMTTFLDAGTMHPHPYRQAWHSARAVHGTVNKMRPSCMPLTMHQVGYHSSCAAARFRGA